MAPILYELSVSMYIRQLEQLLQVLKKGEEFAKQTGKNADMFVQARMSADMNPLAYQIQSSTNTAKAILERLGDAENVSMEDNETTYAQLSERVQKTVDVLKTAKPENFEGKEGTQVVLKFPSRTLEFTGLSYLQKFGLPNFYFHVVTAYDILRKEGVPVGKMDYLGSV